VAGVNVWRARRGRGPSGGPGGEQYDAPLTNADQGGPERRREASWEIHQRRQFEQHQELVGLLSQAVASIGGLFDALTKAPESDVLFSGSVLMKETDVDTYNAEIEVRQPAAYVAVFDANGVGPITVSDSTSSASAPSHGPGVMIVPKYGAVGFPLRANAVRIMSAGAGVLSVVVLARPVPPFGAVYSS